MKIIKQGSVFTQQIMFGPIFRWGAREELCRDDIWVEHGKTRRNKQGKAQGRSNSSSTRNALWEWFWCNLATFRNSQKGLSRQSIVGTGGRWGPRVQAKSFNFILSVVGIHRRFYSEIERFNTIDTLKWNLQNTTIARSFYFLET